MAKAGYYLLFLKKRSASSICQGDHWACFEMCSCFENMGSGSARLAVVWTYNWNTESWFSVMCWRDQALSCLDLQYNEIQTDEHFHLRFWKEEEKWNPSQNNNSKQMKNHPQLQKRSNQAKKYMSEGWSQLHLSRKTLNSLFHHRREQHSPCAAVCVHAKNGNPKITFQ